MIVENGGVFEVENTDGVTDRALFLLGRNNGNYGYAMVRGSGSRISVTQNGAVGDSYTQGAYVHVGNFGQGVLKVEYGALVGALVLGAWLLKADPMKTL